MIRAFLVLALLAAPAVAGAAPLKVVASFSVLGDLVKQSAARMSRCAVARRWAGEHVPRHGAAQYRDAGEVYEPAVNLC